MAWTNYKNTAAIGTTEYSMPNAANFAAGSVLTNTGQISGVIDTSAIARGDVFELALHRKANGSGDTLRRLVICPQLPIGPLFYVPAIIVAHGWDITLDKLSGTDRTITWDFWLIPQSA